MTHNQKYKSAPKGTRRSYGERLCISVGFDPKDMQRISDFAKNENLSFAAAIRSLVDRGFSTTPDGARDA